MNRYLFLVSMLREHGVHRPSVFEVLDTVHRMRATKSRFTYVCIICNYCRTYLIMPLDNTSIESSFTEEATFSIGTSRNIDTV